MRMQFTAVVALVFATSTAAPADEPARLVRATSTPLDRAILTCVGPEFDSARVSYDQLAGLPMENCVRACKAAAQGCRAVVRAVDRCGVSMLKAEAKVALELCRGYGGSAQDCSRVRTDARLSMDWWKNAGREEQATCDEDTQVSCMSRCQPTRRVNVPPVLVNPIVRPGVAPESGSSLTLYESLVPVGQFGIQQGGASSSLGSITIQDPNPAPIPDVSPLLDPGQAATLYVFREGELTTISGDSEVREGAEDRIEFLE
jgi:hypothetical protein